MKTFMCILLSFFIVAAKAAPRLDTTKSTSKNAGENYWVLETGKTGNNSYTIIRFYDAASNLLVEKRLEDVVLKGNRGRVQRQLNRALEAYSTQSAVYTDYLAVLSKRP
ncbi:MAG: hypothetical protein J0I41_19960 [Filimonas sp.]|nr:hypothetical protein [Filimonas sp.]